MIHTEVEVFNGGRKFLCTFVYDLNDRQGRQELWKDIRSVASSTQPWIIQGDFNALMNIEDRIGRGLEQGKL